MIVEIVKINRENYHVFVKCNGTDNISSQEDKLDKADYELFKFNNLNFCRFTKLI